MAGILCDDAPGEAGGSGSFPGAWALIPPPVCCLPWILAEPLFGVIEGVSAGLFLIGMLVAVVALSICRRKAR